MHRLGRGGAARPAATRRYSCGVAGAPILVAPEIMHSKVELGCGEEVHGLRGAEQHHHLRASSLAAAHLPSFSTSVIPSTLTCISRSIASASILPPLASGAAAGWRPGAAQHEECGCERAAGSVTSAARGGSPLCESEQSVGHRRADMERVEKMKRKRG